MSSHEITVYYDYESQKQIPFKCKSNEKIKDVCKFIASKIKKDIDSLNFLLNGDIVSENNFDKTVGEFVSPLNKGILSICVKDSFKSENTALLNVKEEVQVIFHFNNESIEIQCNLNTRLNVTIENFAKTKELQINDLNFYYQEEQLNTNKTFKEIANIADKNQGKIEVIVEQKNIRLENKIIKNKSFCQENKKKYYL